MSQVSCSALVRIPRNGEDLKFKGREDERRVQMATSQDEWSRRKRRSIVATTGYTALAIYLCILSLHDLVAVRS